MHVWINGVLYLFTEMMETCQQLKSQWLHQILTQGSQKCRKNKLEKKKKTGKIQRADVGIIQILWKNCCIIVIFSVEWNMWKKIHNSTYRVSKSQWACFFSNTKWKSNREVTPTFLYNLGEKYYSHVIRYLITIYFQNLCYTRLFWPFELNPNISII